MREILSFPFKQGLLMKFCIVIKTVEISSELRDPIILLIKSSKLLRLNSDNS